MEEEKHVSMKHLEKLLFQEFQKLHEKFDRIERNYKKNYKKRDGEKEIEDRRVKSEGQTKKHIANFDVFWGNFQNKEIGREKRKQEIKEKLESEVKGEEIIEKEIENIFVAIENVTIPKSEKEKREIIEKEIDTVFVATENVIIPFNNVYFTSCTLESLSQGEVSEEDRNLTFERSKEKEVEKMENCERKYNDVIEVEEKENIERKEEKKNECEVKEIYERKINEEVEKDVNFEKIEEEKFNLQKEREYPKERIFFTNPLVIYAGLDLRTNPLEEGENDTIMSSLNMWKETYKKMHKKIFG
ncbi:unnamed protein product [Trifolium pratense]|uniref:Uncharacterized protein n=1 Tax=Trifolium pratense TaxID=57577 RepID=A0ACB0K799_TRIPR|nr:unnamed protein product [Trifolium pratense]